MPRNGPQTSIASRLAAARINFRYFGGPVMRGPTRTVPIFWAPSDLTYESLIQRFLNDIGGHGLYNIVTQYYQLSVSSQRQYIVNSSGMLMAVFDRSPYPAAVDACATNGLTNCLTDGQIQDEITKVIGDNSLPKDLSTVYVVLTAPSEYSCLSTTICFWPNDPGNMKWVYCAYHGMFSIGGQPVVYANMPYLETNYLSILGCGGGTADPNADPAFDDETSALSHELIEAVTDPDPTDGAWFDNSSGYEIGDLCNARATTVKWGTHSYVVQKEWSNATAACVAGGDNAVSLSPPTGVAGSSTSVSGVRFGKNERVRLSMSDASGVATNLGTAKTNGSGVFHVAVGIPGGAPDGVAVIDATGATPGDGASAGFTVNGSSKFRPDLMVAPSMSGPRGGNNIYNITGQGQMIARSLKRRHAVAVWVVVQNDGNAVDTYTLKGPKIPTGFSFVYQVGSAKVSGLMRRGAYRRVLGPGESFLIRVVVRVRSSARDGSRFLAKIRVTSRGNVTHRDAVLVSVTAR